MTSQQRWWRAGSPALLCSDQPQWLDFARNPSLGRVMENNHGIGRKGPSRRAFLSASAATAVAAPIVARTATAHASTTSSRPLRPPQEFAAPLPDLLHHTHPR